MPPEGFTTVTTLDSTDQKLTELIIKHGLNGVADAIDFAADTARDSEALSDAESARLLY